MRICAFGDSIMNGTGDPEALGWIGRAVRPEKARDREVTLYNLGIRRDTGADIRRRWQAEAVVRRPPDLPPDLPFGLLFSFGVNDSVLDAATGRPRQSPEASCEDAAAILAQAPALGRVLMVGPGPVADEAVNARIASLDAALSAVADAAGVPYRSVYAALRADPTWMAEVARWDGAHPGAAGYAVLAKLVADWDAWRAWFEGP